MRDATNLNPKLKGLPNGAKVSEVYLAHFDGTRHHLGPVHVFWPFVVFKQGGIWNVTHAPSGRHVYTARSLRMGSTKALELREAADFEFVSTSSRKAQRAKKAVNHLLPALHRVG